MERPSAESSRTCESFTEDIVVEILLRLPAKSLLRFKCVSKRWRSLISDQRFARSHLQRLKAGDMVSSQRIVKTGPLETIDYEALDDGGGGGDDRAVVRFHEPDPSSWPELVGSCDGLVCLSVNSRGFILYNPTTKESRNLPGSDLFQLDGLLHGFGYDSRCDDYKIVQRESPEDTHENWEDTHENWQVAIFSLKSGSWRRTQAQLESHLVLIEPGEGEPREGVYWNGALHWCVVDHSKEKAVTAIISFDLSEEKFQQVLPVPEVNAGLHFKGLGIHGANLFMYHGTNDDRFQAWITSEQGGSWTKLFSVSTETIPACSYLHKIPVAYTRRGKIVFRFSYEIILFNPEDNTYKEYPIQRSPLIDSAIYAETLVSPYLGYEPSRI